MAFNINAQVVLSGPKNIQKVRGNIRKQLSGLNVPIKLQLDSDVSKALTNINKSFSNLSTNLSNLNNQAKITSKQLNGLKNTSIAANTSANNLAKGTNALGKSIKNVGSEAATAGSEIEAFGKDAALAIRRFSAFTIATGAVFGFVRAVQTATGEAIKFERELARITQVTGATSKQLKGLQSTIDDLATGLGLDANKLLEVSRIFAQTGQSIDQVRASITAVARASLAPTFGDIEKTTEGVVAALNQFNISAKKSEGVLGSLNAVSKRFAVESDDLISVIRRAGGVFAASSEQLGKPEERLSELIGIFTAVRSTTRESADTIATGLRTIFTRVQRPQTIKFLEQFGIQLRATAADAKALGIAEGEFVGIFEAFKRISQQIDGLDTLQLAKVVEELGGIRQVGKLIPALKNFEKAERARAIALKGTESISKDVGIATQTLSVQIEQLQQRFGKFVRDVAQSATFQNLAKFAISTANAFLTLADALRPALPLLTAIAGIKLTSAAFDFAKGFIGGIKKGGGAGGVGSGIAGLATGTGREDAASKALSQKQASTVTANTAAINKNTTALNTLNNTTKSLTTAANSLVSKATDVSTKTSALIGALAKLPVQLQAAVSKGGLASGLAAGATGKGRSKKARGGSIPKFARGGFVSGPSHAQGGVVAELEGGEFVVPKRQAKAIGGLVKQSGVGIVSSEFIDPDRTGTISATLDQVINSGRVRGGSLSLKKAAEGIDPKYSSRLPASDVKKALGTSKSSFDFDVLVEGVSSDEEGVFRKAFNNGVESALTTAGNDIANYIGASSPDFSQIGANEDFYKTFDVGFKGLLFENVLAALGGQPLRASDTNRPFDFTDGLPSQVSKPYSNTLSKGLQYVDAKISAKSATVKSLDNKVVNQIAEDALAGLPDVVAAKRAAKSAKKGKGAAVGGPITGPENGPVPVAISDGELVVPPEEAAKNLNALQRANRGFFAGNLLDRLPNSTIASGPGTGTSDSILTELPAGSFVVNAKDTGRIFGDRQRASAGGRISFGSGGRIKRTGMQGGGLLSGVGGGSGLLQLVSQIALVGGVVSSLDFSSFEGFLSAVSTAAIPLAILSQGLGKADSAGDDIQSASEEAANAISEGGDQVAAALSEASAKAETTEKEDKPITTSKEGREKLATQRQQSSDLQTKIRETEDEGEEIKKKRDAKARGLSNSEAALERRKTKRSTAKAALTNAVKSKDAGAILAAQVNLDKANEAYDEQAEKLTALKEEISGYDEALENNGKSVEALKEQLGSLDESLESTRQKTLELQDAEEAKAKRGTIQSRKEKFLQDAGGDKKKARQARLDAINRRRAAKGRGALTSKSLGKRLPFGKRNFPTLTKGLGGLTKGISSLKQGFAPLTKFAAQVGARASNPAVLAATAAAAAVGPIADGIAEQIVGKREEVGGVKGFSEAQGGQQTAQLLGGAKGAISGGLGGAALGFTLGGPVGAAIGGVIGTVGGAIKGAFDAFINQAKFEALDSTNKKAEQFGKTLDDLAGDGIKNKKALEATSKAAKQLTSSVLSTSARLTELQFGGGQEFFGSGVSGSLGGGIIGQAVDGLALLTSAFSTSAGILDSLGIGADVAIASSIGTQLFAPQQAKDAQARIVSRANIGKSSAEAEAFGRTLDLIKPETIKKAEEASNRLNQTLVEAVPIGELGDLVKLGADSTFDDLATALESASSESEVFKEQLETFKQLQGIKIAASAKELRDNFATLAGEDVGKKQFFEAGVNASRDFLAGFSKTGSFKDATSAGQKGLFQQLNQRRVAGAIQTGVRVEDIFKDFDELKSAVDGTSENALEASLKLQELGTVLNRKPEEIKTLVTSFDNLTKSTANAAAAQAKELAVRRLQEAILKSTARSIDALASALERLTQGVTRAVSDFAITLSNVEAEVARASSIEQSVSPVQRQNVFNNVQGANIGELRAGVERVRAGVGGDPAAFDDLASTVQLGTELPQALKDVLDDIELSGDEVSFVDFQDKLIKKLEKEANFNELSDVVKRQFNNTLEAIFAGTRQGETLGAEGLRTLLEETGGLDKFAELGAKTTEALAAVTDQLNEFNSALLQSVNLQIQATRIRTDAELKSAKLAEEVADRFAKFGQPRATDEVTRAQTSLRNEVNTLLNQGGAGTANVRTAGGVVNLGGVGGGDLLKRQEGLENIRKELLGRIGEVSGVDPNDKKALEALDIPEITALQSELANVTSALEGTKKSIDVLSNDTRVLSAVESKLTAIQESRLTGRQRATAALGQLSNARTPEDRARIVADLQRPLVAAVKASQGQQLDIKEFAALAQSLDEGGPGAVAELLRRANPGASEEKIAQLVDQSRANVQKGFLQDVAPNAVAGGLGFNKEFADVLFNPQGAAVTAAGETKEEQGLLKIKDQVLALQQGLIKGTADQTAAAIAEQQAVLKTELEQTKTKLVETADAFALLRAEQEKLIATSIQAAAVLADAKRAEETEKDQQKLVEREKQAGKIGSAIELQSETQGPQLEKEKDRFSAVLEASSSTFSDNAEFLQSYLGGAGISREQVLPEFIKRLKETTGQGADSDVLGDRNVQQAFGIGFNNAEITDEQFKKQEESRRAIFKEIGGIVFGESAGSEERTDLLVKTLERKLLTGVAGVRPQDTDASDFGDDLVNIITDSLNADVSRIGQFSGSGTDKFDELKFSADEFGIDKALLTEALGGDKAARERAGEVFASDTNEITGKELQAVKTLLDKQNKQTQASLDKSKAESDVGPILNALQRQFSGQKVSPEQQNLINSISGLNDEQKSTVTAFQQALQREKDKKAGEDAGAGGAKPTKAGTVNGVPIMIDRAGALQNERADAASVAGVAGEQGGGLFPVDDSLKNTAAASDTLEQSLLQTADGFKKFQEKLNSIPGLAPEVKKAQDAILGNIGPAGGGKPAFTPDTNDVALLSAEVLTPLQQQRKAKREAFEAEKKRRREAFEAEKTRRQQSDPRQQRRDAAQSATRFQNLQRTVRSEKAVEGQISEAQGQLNNIEFNPQGAAGTLTPEQQAQKAALQEKISGLKKRQGALGDRRGALEASIARSGLENPQNAASQALFGAVKQRTGEEQLKFVQRFEGKEKQAVAQKLLQGNQLQGKERQRIEDIASGQLDQAKTALEGVVNTFGSILQNNTFAGQLTTAAETLKNLPELQVALDANVGKVEVVLNGASMLAQFGEQVKGEILQAVAEKIAGLIPNAAGQQGDPSLGSTPTQ